MRHTTIVLLIASAAWTAAPSASAAIITYTFGGAAQYSETGERQVTFNLMTGAFSDTALWNSTGVVTGGLRFMLDSSRYTDEARGTTGVSMRRTSNSDRPWLSSLSLMSGPLSNKLYTPGTSFSLIYASEKETDDGWGFLRIIDQMVWDPGTVTLDEAGRPVREHRSFGLNAAYLYGDIELSEIDGVEVPLGASAFSPRDSGPFFEQLWVDQTRLLSYDALGRLVSHMYSESTYYTRFKSAAFSVTQETDEINGVSEPASFALVGLGLVGFSLSRLAGAAGSAEGKRIGRFRCPSAKCNF